MSENGSEIVEFVKFGQSFGFLMRRRERESRVGIAPNNMIRKKRHCLGFGGGMGVSEAVADSAAALSFS